MTYCVFKLSRMVNGKRVRSRLYSGEYRLAGDQKPTRVALGTSDKQVAEQKLREIVRDREQEAAGILLPKRVRDAAQESVTDHLRDYIADLTAQKRDGKYIYTAEKRIAKLAEECCWAHLCDVTADSFQAWRARQNTAPKTLNDYLAAVSAFFHWLECNGRVTCNPLKHVRKVEARGNQRRLRRAFTTDEFNRLLAVSGPRKVVYLAAVFTGLRRAELEQLQWGDVHLEDEVPFLAVRASTTKNHEQADICLHKQLETELRKIRPVNARPTDLVFGKGLMPNRMRQFKKDLTAAKIPYKDEDGRQADFHALRGTFCTNLAVHGVDAQTRKEIMRHSEISLTLNNYTDVRQLKTSEAIRALPAFIPDSYAVGYAVNSVKRGQTLSEGVTNRANERLSEVADLERDSQALSATVTAEPVHKNGSPLQPLFEYCLSLFLYFLLIMNDLRSSNPFRFGLAAF